MKNLRTQQAALDATGDAGIWVSFDDETRFKVSAISSPSFQAITETAQKRMRAAFKNKKVPAKDSEKVFIECMAEGVVHAWEGVSVVDGEALEFTRENVLVVLKEFKRIREFIVLFALDDENFSDAPAAAEAEQTKN